MSDTTSPKYCLACRDEYSPKWTLSPLMNNQCCWGCLFINEWVECPVPEELKGQTCSQCNQEFRSGVCDLLPEICWYCAKKESLVVNEEEFAQVLVLESNLPENARLRRYVRLCLRGESFAARNLGMEISDICTKSMQIVMEDDDIPVVNFLGQPHFLRSDLVKAIWQVIKDNLEEVEAIVASAQKPIGV